jgi:hypothetical protein
MRGEEIRYDWTTQSATGFKSFERETNGLSWYPYKSLNGTYDVEITYACDNAAAGSRMRLAAGRRGAPGESVIEAVVEKTGGGFVTRKLNGKLTVTPATETIGLQLEGDDRSAGMKVRKITLVKSPA